MSKFISIVFSALFLLPLDAQITVKNDFDLSVPGNIIHKKVMDINKDGLLDIAFTFTPAQEPQKIYFDIFLNRRGSFIRSGMVDLTGCSVYCLYDFNQDGFSDLVFIKKEIVYLKITGKKGDGLKIGSSREILSVSCLYSYTPAENIVWADIAGDFNSDGLPDLLLPHYSGLLFFAGDKSGIFKKTLVLSVPVEAQFSGFQQMQFDFMKTPQSFYNIVIPAVETADFNRDRTADLICYGNNQIRIFPVKNHEISAEPLIFDFILQKDNRPGTMPLLLSVSDLGSPGFLDFICKKIARSEKFLETETMLYICRGSGTSGSFVLENPLIRESGMLAMFPPVLRDFNSDGRMDIMDFHIEFSFGKALTAVLAKSSTLNLVRYLQNEQDTFLRADDTRKIKINMQFSMPYILSIVSASGDFNGDSREDLLVGNLEKNLLQIFSGNSNGTFSAQPVFSYSTVLYLKINIHDFDADGRDDILMMHLQSGEMKVVIF